MRIIAVMSPKGGIGKTTTSDAIAYMLGEEQEKRVLILDGDPQGDTSKTFEAYEPEGTGMSELLERHVSVGGSYRTTDLIRPTQYSHIDIIPANGYLMQTDMNLLLKQEAKEKAIQNVAALFGEAAAPEKRCSEGIVNILKAAVEEIYTGGLAKVTLNLRGGVKASISQNSKGEINVERTETKKQKLTE